MPGRSSGTRGRAVVVSRALAAGCPLSPSIAANALLDAQQTIGNEAGANLVRTGGELSRTLSRKPDGKGSPLKPVPPRATPDTELWFSKGYDPPWYGTRVTEETLSAWAVGPLSPRMAEREIVSNILSSHEFTGSQEARTYWASFVTRNGVEYLQGILAGKVQASHERRRWEQQDEERLRRLTEFRSHAYEGVEEFTNGSFQRDTPTRATSSWQPCASASTLSTPTPRIRSI
jgi:hypothetical protein